MKVHANPNGFHSDLFCGNDVLVYPIFVKVNANHSEPLMRQLNGISSRATAQIKYPRPGRESQLGADEFNCGSDVFLLDKYWTVVLE